ncbi:unnamed protein product, partial [Prorocentrum cordatum]
VLRVLCKEASGCEERELIAALQLRSFASGTGDEALEKMEGAAKKMDSKGAMRAQKKVHCSSYNKRMNETKVKSTSGARKPRKPSDYRGPARCPDRAIEQPGAKLYIPPSTTMWRGSLGS